MKVAKNEVVYRAGGPPGGLYGLIRGALRIQLMVGGVGEQVAYVAYPGFWVGTIATIRRMPRQVTLSAASPSTLAYLPLQVFDELAKDAENMLYFAHLAADNNMFVLDGVRHLLIPDVKARIAAKLLSIAGLTGDDAGQHRTIALTQSDLAMTCSLSRKAINQHLSCFAKLGLVEIGYGEIVIKDVAELDRIAHRVTE